MSVPPPRVRVFPRYGFVLPDETEPLSFVEANRHDWCDTCPHKPTEVARTERGDLMCERCAENEGRLIDLDQYEPQEVPC